MNYQSYYFLNMFISHKGMKAFIIKRKY